nr:hypothetical protein [uncultured Albidiferax sp.]
MAEGKNLDPHASATATLVGVLAVLVGELAASKSINVERLAQRLDAILQRDEENPSQLEGDAMAAAVINVIKLSARGQEK